MNTNQMKKALGIATMALLFLVGCKEAKKEAADKTETAVEETKAAPEEQAPVKTTVNVAGNYVSDGYAQKDEGYDWVAVSVTDAKDGAIGIKVRSRADKKKPTCTLDVTASHQEGGVYRATLQGKGILFTFSGDGLTIAPEASADEGVLYFYCSGGATVAGQYSKINGGLDQAQIDKTLFNKTLMLQDIGFNVTAMAKGGKHVLTVAPFGLEITNDPVTTDVDGEVVDAAVEDLNSDGSPELVVFTKTSGSGNYGHVIAYSTNNKKSMSMAHFPITADNGDINQGYKGHDEFALVETSLVQRFPIYEGDTKTDKVRQISYKLVDGEAMRAFAVDAVNEF